MDCINAMYKFFPALWKHLLIFLYLKCYLGNYIWIIWLASGWLWLQLTLFSGFVNYHMVREAYDGTFPLNDSKKWHNNSCFGPCVLMLIFGFERSEIFYSSLKIHEFSFIAIDDRYGGWSSMAFLKA